MLAKVHTKICPHKKRKAKKRLLMVSVAPFVGLVKKQYSVTRDIPDSALCTSDRKQLPVLCRGRGNLELKSL